MAARFAFLNMGTQAFRNVRVLLTLAVLSSAWPAVAAGQDAGIGVSIQGAIGTHIGDGGNAESIGLGVSFGKHFAVVVNAERSHVPTNVTYFEDGYSATRGGTVTFISGEFRYVPITVKRISPYAIVGIGRGVSRPNVNEFFPDRVEHTVTLVFPGFGASVRLTEHLSAFADFRLMLQSRSGVPDGGVLGPVRGGLAWRF